MDFTFAVGTQEVHEVHYHFNQWFGRVTITVDGEDWASRWRMFTVKVTQRFEFEVGDTEKHDVVIEKTRKAFLGGVQDQRCEVSVDGVTVGNFLGSVTGKTTML